MTREPPLTPGGMAFSELVLEVFRLNGLALQAGDALTAPCLLTSARWQVLGVVDHSPAPVAHIARTMGLTRQSVQLTANALARDGFVSYADNPHHRTAQLVVITGTGRRALRQVERRHATWASRLGERLGRAKLRTLVEGLRDVRAVLEEAVA